MPVQYKGALAEVDAVRNNAGIFDVSHMGQILIPANNKNILALEKFRDRMFRVYDIKKKEIKSIHNILIVEGRCSEQELEILKIFMIKYHC